MEVYEQLRHFADSWGLLLMTLFFVAAIAWALRPGALQSYREQADIIFKHDDRGLTWRSLARQVNRMMRAGNSTNPRAR
jgi:cytochrome c oxidase cbb3-type subunit 4